jgi:PLP dependent protein
MDLRNNIKSVRERIENAAKRAGRNQDDIKLVAVTKGVEPERMIEAVSLGIHTFGENYAQEFRLKKEIIDTTVSENVEWHFIGKLQRNKVKYIVGDVEMIHSLDSMTVAREIEKRATSLGIKSRVLIEVDTGEEETKGGVRRDGVERFLKELQGFHSIEVHGLMTMPPYFDDPESARSYFITLRELRDRLSLEYSELRELSVGMSGDFEVAIEEGATLVRVGTAIFGQRQL